MEKLQLFLCVVIVGLLLYLYVQPDCENKNVDLPPPPPNAPPEIKEAHAIEEVKNAKKDADKAENNVSMANDKLKNAINKLRRVRESLYTPPSY